MNKQKEIAKRQIGLLKFIWGQIVSSKQQRLNINPRYEYNFI